MVLLAKEFSCQTTAQALSPVTLNSLTGYNHKLDVGKRFCKTNPDTPPFDESYPLVFTHNDISMRNVILGDDGKVYLVDWAFSGFYPAWMEYHSKSSPRFCVKIS
ncbi:hypothetical protein C8Q75DRAFT_833485 [Abortiporus biennis]|nr:hypothetical protein C8Q75DRAFT_833485 [Abortiporus biennis]